MSKIVQAVNAMISNSEHISPVYQGEHELFFVYKKKFKWSMIRNDDGTHFLWFYPGKQTIEELVETEGPNWEDIAMVVYKDSEVGTREARASFAELFQILKEKVYGVDKALDEIINDDIPF